MHDPDRPARARRPRGDSGLTTLEWLLITAAVAGLAALAVVLVQVYVEDTGDRMSNPDPRVTSAIYSASEVEIKAKAASAADFGLWADWKSHFTQRCSLIAVLYADAEVEVAHNNFNGRPAAARRSTPRRPATQPTRTSSPPPIPRPRCSAKCAEPLSDHQIEGALTHAR